MAQAASLAVAKTATTDRLYAIGEMPELGVVPKQMHAWTVRADRFGEPRDAFATEVTDTPELGPHDVLVYVMAAGVNYNNVWAALGLPINVIKNRNKQGEPEDFHIGGSDASGIVYAVGEAVSNVHIGDEVVLHCGQWEHDCAWVRGGSDPMYSPTFRIWGYESNYGSFAQFARVQAHQCMPKPRHMTWEQAASYSLVGATAYRMLHGWSGHEVKADDVVLVWGGAGGLGSMAIQIACAAGATPIAVVSGKDKFEFCEGLGAKGCIDRSEFEHWGMLPHWKDSVGYGKWLGGVRDFGARIWEILGERRSPNIVFEHPGEATLPTSMFVCDTGGLVVICAGTTGYNATVDLRYQWMRQKRLQGSHFANDEQSYAMNRLAVSGKLDPCMSQAFTYDDLPTAHQLMHDNRHPYGNMAVLIGAPGFGEGVGSATPVVRELRTVPAFARQAQTTTPRYPWSAPLPEVLRQIGNANPVVEDDGSEVEALMSKSIVSCGPADSVHTAATLMAAHRINAVVVMQNAEALGVISQTDVVLARQGRTREDAQALEVGTIMTEGCVTCDVTTPLSDAISTMARLKIHRLVVTRYEGERDVPVGLLSMTDIVRKVML
jgi:crotonyl-CoA carboxylase/reductase